MLKDGAPCRYPSTRAPRSNASHGSSTSQSGSHATRPQSTSLRRELIRSLAAATPARSCRPCSGRSWERAFLGRVRSKTPSSASKHLRSSSVSSGTGGGGPSLLGSSPRVAHSSCTSLGLKRHGIKYKEPGCSQNFLGVISAQSSTGCV